MVGSLCYADQTVKLPSRPGGDVSADEARTGVGWRCNRCATRVAADENGVGCATRAYAIPPPFRLRRNIPSLAGGEFNRLPCITPNS